MGLKTSATVQPLVGLELKMAKDLHLLDRLKVLSDEFP
jgi:hypothetical protein